jgi:hypothetical protein
MDKVVNNQNVPQQVKDTYKKAMTDNRDAWKKAAANPQTKAALESGCKQALDAAKTVFDQYAK